MHKNILFQIHHMEVEQFAALEDPKEEKSSFSVSIRPGCNFGLRAIAISVWIQFVCDSHPFLILKTNAFYQLNQESWDQLTEKESGRVVIPKPFIETLVQISVSQARGVLFAKTENSPFSKYFLPIVNVESFNISGDMIISPEGAIVE